jgi:hypothetical protein|tara:strand:+ start:1544 stop:1750 length:207 start_codon:yes stop_codon:yes gene_type:complete
MYYIVRDVTGAAITYERVGKAFFEEGAANCMAKEISKKGGQPLRVVNTTEYREMRTYWRPQRNLLGIA